MLLIGPGVKPIFAYTLTQSKDSLNRSPSISFTRPPFHVISGKNKNKKRIHLLI